MSAVYAEYPLLYYSSHHNAKLNPSTYMERLHLEYGAKTEKKKNYIVILNLLSE